MSLVTANRSTVPGREETTGTKTTTLDNSGGMNFFPFPRTSVGGDCRLRMLSSSKASS